MTQRYYKVAQQVFSVGFDTAIESSLAELLKAYEPFEVEATEVLFSLDIKTGTMEEPSSFTLEYRQNDEGQVITSGHQDDGSKVFGYEFGKERALMLCSADYRQAELQMGEKLCKAAIDTSLMLLFALTTANKNTLLFHSSTTVWQGKAYMFLGVSGTGKSTHSGLWLKHIKGTHLLNDDNPVVRIDAEGKPIVCGSPWSGKTPCYRNEEYPLGAIVSLEQAPKNKIKKSSVLEAYAVISSSISSKRWEKDLANGINSSIDAILKKRPVFHLKCLPDKEAALVCWSTIAKYSYIDDVKSIIDEDHPVILPAKGNSMLPFIHSGDNVELCPIHTELKRGDIVLAKTQEGHPVIHRIVKIDEDKITLEGDGNLGFQEHCLRQDVIAQVHRDDKHQWQLWMTLRPIRRILLKLYKITHGIK